MFLTSRIGRLGLVLTAGTVALVAQGVQMGTVSGIVKSKAGQPIKGARVVIKTAQGERNTVTNATGEYRFPLLVVGNVRVVVSAEGYIGSMAETRVNIDRTSMVDFSLRHQETQGATVEVVAGSNRIDTTDTKSGENLALESIDKLPINSRDIVTIASLAPGTSRDGNGMTIRGSQATQVQYLVDGADVADPVTGGPAVRLNEEMLEEVQVINGAAPAEYGRVNGGVVNTVTKSGTNTFSGSLRWDVTNNDWNAYNPLNRGKDGKTAYKNAHTTTQSYMVSGPIWKDHIFFVLGYRTSSPMLMTPGTTNSPDWGGKAFIATRQEERKDWKIDYVFMPGHRVFYQYNETIAKRTNVNYPSSFGYGGTTVETLSSQADSFKYSVFGYAGQITDRLLIDFRMNDKKEILGDGKVGTSGGQGGKKVAWIDLNTSDIFDNGFFGASGDSRPIKNYNLNATYFFEAMGNHELKGGYQFFESSRNAANEQTPSNYFIYFNGFKPDTTTSDVANRVLTPNDEALTYLEHWDPVYGAKTKNQTKSFFLQDKWKLNNHLSFNLGVRHDQFISADDLGRDNYSIGAFSPRFTGSYDFKGDGTSVLSASYNVFVGQLNQGATDASSPAGNPILRQYVYLGGNAVDANGNLNRSAFAATPFYYEDPFNDRSTKIDPNIKMPSTHEIQVMYRKATETGGTYTFTFVKRTYKDMVDDFKSIDPNNSKVLLTYITNDPGIKRDYMGLEVQIEQRLTDRFKVGANITMSELKGNMEGGQTGANDQRNNFPSSFVDKTGNAVNNEVLSPYGFLAADRPLSVVATAEYNQPLGKGMLSMSAMGYFNSGAPYSITAGSIPTGLSTYSSSYTRYYTDRGALRFPNSHSVDFQVQYSQPLYKKVEFWARLNITNVFNHQILRSWVTTANYEKGYYDANGDPILGANGKPLQLADSSKWRPGSGFGRPSSSADYLGARSLNLAAGIRF